MQPTEEAGPDKQLAAAWEPTKAQIALIRNIERYVDVVYRGKDNKELSEFITKHYKTYYEKRLHRIIFLKQMRKWKRDERQINRQSFRVEIPRWVKPPQPPKRTPGEKARDKKARRDARYLAAAEAELYQIYASGRAYEEGFYH
jgi:hypothetical protein